MMVDDMLNLNGPLHVRWNLLNKERTSSMLGESRHGLAQVLLVNRMNWLA